MKKNRIPTTKIILYIINFQKLEQKLLNFHLFQNNQLEFRKLKLFGRNIKLLF